MPPLGLLFGHQNGLAVDIIDAVDKFPVISNKLVDVVVNTTEFRISTFEKFLRQINDFQESIANTEKNYEEGITRAKHDIIQQHHHDRKNTKDLINIIFFIVDSLTDKLGHAEERVLAF